MIEGKMYRKKFLIPSSSSSGVTNLHLTSDCIPYCEMPGPRERPVKLVVVQRLQSLLSAGVTKTEMATIFCISRPKLNAVIRGDVCNPCFVSSCVQQPSIYFRFLPYLEHCPQYTSWTIITDPELDMKILHAKSQLSSLGERMVIGFLKSEGIRVSRRRIRAAIHRVDPQGVAERRELRNLRIRRRVYWSPYPHYI